MSFFAAESINSIRLSRESESVVPNYIVSGVWAESNLLRAIFGFILLLPFTEVASSKLDTKPDLASVSNPYGGFPIPLVSVTCARLDI